MQVSSIQSQYNRTSFTAIKPFGSNQKAGVEKVVNHSKDLFKSNLSTTAESISKKVNFDKLSFWEKAKLAWQAVSKLS